MASNYRKWNGKEQQNPEDPLHVVLFVSRNKDNKDVPNFEERRRAFLYHIPKDVWKTKGLCKKFQAFVNEGVPSELSRMYVSVNARDPEKIKRELMHRLIDDNLISSCPLTHMDAVMASIGAGKERAAEKHWLFDFDSTDNQELQLVVDEIRRNYGDNNRVDAYKTPNGRAIIVRHGFDMRNCETMKRLNDEGILTLKRDDMLCADWRRK